MIPIKVHHTKLHEARKAFIFLYEREPVIYTCSRFNDEDGMSVFGSCPVLNIGRTKVEVEADDINFKAYIKDIEYFTFE